MTLMEYLKKNELYLFNDGRPVEIIDIITPNLASYASNCSTVISELTSFCMAPVANARFVMCDDKDDRIVLYYVKDLAEYSDWDLAHIVL